MQEGLSMAKNPIAGNPSGIAGPNIPGNGRPANMLQHMSGPGSCQASAAEQVPYAPLSLISEFSVFKLRDMNEVAKQHM